MKKTTLLQKAIFTLDKELEAVSSVRKLLDNNFLKIVDSLTQIRGKIVISGMGKSGQIGVKMASTFVSLGIPAVYLNPAEAMHGDLGVISDGDAIIAISASGETKELLRVLKHVHRHIKIPIVAITGAPRSSLSNISNMTLAFGIREEGSPFNLAPMASATTTLVIGDILATTLSVKKGFTERNFASSHPGGSLGLRLAKVSELSKKGKSLPVVKKNDPFKLILNVMSGNSLGVAAVVDEHKKLVGVITDGDIRRFLLSGKFSEQATARVIMTLRPKTIDEDESLEAALIKMETHKITSLLVADKHKRLTGVILMHDIIEHKML